MRRFSVTPCAARCSPWPLFVLVSLAGCSGDVHGEVRALNEQVVQLSHQLDDIEQGIADLDTRFEDAVGKASEPKAEDYERRCTTVRVTDAKTPNGPDIIRLHDAFLRVSGGEKGVIIVEGQEEGRDVKESKTFASAAFIAHCLEPKN